VSCEIKSTFLKKPILFVPQASVTPAVVYSYKSPYFTTDSRVVQLLQPDSFSNPSSELTIVTLEQPLKCGATFPVTVEYSFVGEAGGYSTDIIYMVSGHLLLFSIPLACLSNRLYFVRSCPEE